jgi:predicted ATPase
MIESIEFRNFKALREATLPLSRFTLIVGPNGSGKSTGLKGITAFQNPGVYHHKNLRTAGVPETVPVGVTARWTDADGAQVGSLLWSASEGTRVAYYVPNASSQAVKVAEVLQGARIFALDAVAIAQPVQLQPNMEMAQSGALLAGVLDRLRDQHPERFEAVNKELGRWVPEFDRILFETPGSGQRSMALRTREGHYPIKAVELSQGTLIALALLTIANSAKPPSIVCLEEPDRGLHPRLLRDVKDALYRLAYPEGSGEKREPVQVIATTHNPYFLDLFREHPEEIVIAEKVGLESKFSRLSDRKDLNEILADAPLSEVWYSGVLGGVPAGT